MTYGGCGSGSSRRRRRGTCKGPQPAEVDAAVAREHAVERAAGDRAQRRSSDGRRGRRGGAHPGGQGKTGRQGAPDDRAVQGPAGQARVHPQGGEPHQAPSTRNSRDRRQRHQARVVNALEPEWEARFEPRSYGFRPGRGCHDAIQADLRGRQGQEPEAPVGAGRRLGRRRSTSSPTTTSWPCSARSPPGEWSAQWLKAGVVEQGRLHRTEDGRSSGRRGQPAAVERRPARDGEAAGVRYTTGK